MIDLFDFAGMWKIEKPDISDFHVIISSSIGSSIVKADATWLNISWTIYYGHFVMVGSAVFLGYYLCPIKQVENSKIE